MAGSDLELIGALVLYGVSTVEELDGVTVDLALRLEIDGDG